MGFDKYYELSLEYLLLLSLLFDRCETCARVQRIKLELVR